MIEITALLAAPLLSRQKRHATVALSPWGSDSEKTVALAQRSGANAAVLLMD
jgi:hypothetical protein